MRSIKCPICNVDVVLYEANGHVYPNLSRRIEDHIQKHTTFDLIEYAMRPMVEQALKYEDELRVPNKKLRDGKNE